jgi:hypothetical protein
MLPIIVKNESFKIFFVTIERKMLSGFTILVPVTMGNVFINVYYSSTLA